MDKKIEILQDVDIKSLKPYAKNIFDHSVNINEIANSIRDFGYNKVSIGIDENNILIYGHGTLLALKLLGYKLVPFICQISGLSDDEKKCYRVADNTSGFNAKIIQDLIKEELSQQATFDFVNYGLPPEYLFDMGNLQSSKDECGKLAEDFARNNPDYIRPEKMWMYVEFQTPQEWDFVINQLGSGKSRRIIDSSKLIGVLNGNLYQEEKKLLKLAMREILPDFITQRRKIGFQDGLGIKNAFKSVCQPSYYKKYYNSIFNA